MKSILLLVIALLTYGCRETQTNISEETKKLRATTTQIEQSKEVKLPKYKKYIYGGISFRDPFIPLSGERLARAKLGLTKEAIRPSLGSLSLKGFIDDSEDKIALFSSPYGSYVLVNGNMYDSQNRLVEGITGKFIIRESKDGKKLGVILRTKEKYSKKFFLKEKM